ncbi:MAG: uracil-DNA glycosylase family protein [Pseudomonadales bacterium]|nr:uracil-DNA glycosylase family protein [Halioglobus sp.]MCP5129258.1 uracil-DNA glycosylase family protein [Pseudomonadales bacterium]
MPDSFELLLEDVRACRLCAGQLGHEPRPVLQVDPGARVLIAGQAPGARVHQTGIPFDDPSGDRLRDWMGIDRDTFYDSSRIAILPMGFCYPGKGRSGDLPPLPVCADTWRRRLLAALTEIELTLVIGQYAMNWHLEGREKNLTETVKRWKDYGSGVLPLPHPSPRNNIWLKRNAWFEAELLPVLKERVKSALA